MRAGKEKGSTMSLDSDLTGGASKVATRRNEKQRAKRSDRTSVDSVSSEGSTVSLTSLLGPPDMDISITTRRKKAVRLSASNELSVPGSSSGHENSRLTPTSNHSSDFTPDREILMKKSPVFKSLTCPPEAPVDSGDDRPHQKLCINHDGGVKTRKDGGTYRRKGDDVKSSKSMRLATVSIRQPVSYIEQVIYELLDTERAYVKDLRDVIQVCFCGLAADRQEYCFTKDFYLFLFIFYFIYFKVYF